MATFHIHNDKENRVREFASKQNVGAGNQKRATLGALENKQNRVQGKQPFGIRNENVFNENVGKKSGPVIPVAQFQAFKVYEEESVEEKKVVQHHADQRLKEVFQNFYKGTAGERLTTKKEALEQSGMLDLPKPNKICSPMSIEKSTQKLERKTEAEAVPACNKSKDLFFEIAEYREHIFAYLRKKELEHRAKPYYMRKQPDITHNMRTILVDWLVEVSEEYKLHTETLYLAVNYIDRFLSYMSVLRAKLQLVGTAAMFIAGKYEEIYPPEVNEFVYITDDTYTKRQVLRMEVLILKVLDFDLSVPTAYTFITALSVMNKLPEKVGFLAQYLSELALLEAEPTLEILPSIMAAAAIAVARNALDDKPWSEELEKTSGYTLPELRTAGQYLMEVHKKASEMQQQAIQEKYRQGKYLHVANVLPAPNDITFD